MPTGVGERFQARANDRNPRLLEIFGVPRVRNPTFNRAGRAGLAVGRAGENEETGDGEPGPKHTG